MPKEEEKKWVHISGRERLRITSPFVYMLIGLLPLDDQATGDKNHTGTPDHMVHIPKQQLFADLAKAYCKWLITLSLRRDEQNHIVGCISLTNCTAFITFIINTSSLFGVRSKYLSLAGLCPCPAETFCPAVCSWGWWVPQRFPWLRLRYHWESLPCLSPWRSSSSASSSPWPSDAPHGCCCWRRTASCRWSHC